MHVERRSQGLLDKTGKLFSSLLPIIAVIGFIVAVIITFSKINPLCDTVEKEIKPDIRILQMKVAVYDEKLSNIDKNIAEIKDMLKRRQGGQ